MLCLHRMLSLPKEYLSFEGKGDVPKENVPKLRPKGQIEWSDLQCILSKARRQEKAQLP